MNLLRLLVVLSCVAGCRRGTEHSGAFTHEVYLWQRAWTPEVRAALKSGAERFERLVVFTGEVSLAGGKPKVVRPGIDYAALKATGQRCGLAVRIDPFAGPFRADDEPARAIVELARERVAEARRAGIEPAELQIDFDCAESKLGGYRVWLRAVREAVKPLPVCPTALPSWLKQREFAALARECGAYILQVHCVAPPRELATIGPLADPARAAEWVEQAGRIGVPFRVALPTYTYLVAFDAAGKARGVSAEGPSAQWPADSQVVRWEADPTDLARLIGRWKRARPAAMSGVIWYRLPVASDALNWRWPTLSAVMQGRVPRSNLRVEASDQQPSEIVVINDGERDEPLPARIEARWSGARLVAADALAGYELQRSATDPEHAVDFIRAAGSGLSRLPPGTRRPTGWIRCENPTPIQLKIRAAADDSASARPAAVLADGPGDGH